MKSLLTFKLLIMKEHLLPLIFLSMVFSASAQTDTVEPAKLKKPSIATISTMDGKKIKGWFYKTDSDNIFLLSTKIKAQKPLNNKSPALENGSNKIDVIQINTIVLKKKNAGLKGALIGLAAGVVVGAIIGFASGDDPVKPYTGDAYSDVFIDLGNAFALTATEKAAGLSVVGGMTGALIGGITGALLKKKFIIGGKKDNYKNAQAELNKMAMVKF
jgi:hypothetical protein